jgi:hypothetical protein
MQVMSNTAKKPTPDTNNTTEPKSWRDQLPIHPAAELFPQMPEPKLRKVGENIKAQGLKLPVAVCKGQLIDGRNRLDAMELVGIKFGFSHLGDRKFTNLVIDDRALDKLSGDNVVITDIGDRDPYEYVLSINIYRRHLTPEQRNDLITKVLKARPEVSNRRIAAELKVDHKKVAAVRRAGEATGEISPVEKTTGKDGKARPARKSASNVPPKRPSKRRPKPERPPPWERPVSEWAGVGSLRYMLGEMALSDPARARRCVEEIKAELYAAIDKAILDAAEEKAILEAAAEDQSDQQNTRNEHERMLLDDGLPEAFIRSRGQ